jgi:hypothetical protein
MTAGPNPVAEGAAMRAALAGLVLAALAGVGRAGEPVVAPAVPVAPGPLPPLGYYRVSAYEVWQNLAVDRNGFFRPRVVSTPYGAYYRYNGRPYPWMSVKPFDVAPAVTAPAWMPYVTE